MSKSAYRTLPNVPPATVNKITGELQNWLDILDDVVRGMMQGNMNVGCSAPVTLTPGATSTVINDARIGGTSIILLAPATANAAAALPTTWIGTPVKTSATINHASSALTDLTFEYVIIG